jgi:hypothetical protein
MSTQAQRRELRRMALAVLQGTFQASPFAWHSHADLVRGMQAIVAGDVDEMREAMYEAMEQVGRSRVDVRVEEDVRRGPGNDTQARYAIAICYVPQ